MRDTSLRVLSVADGVNAPSEAWVDPTLAPTAVAARGGWLYVADASEGYRLLAYDVSVAGTPGAPLLVDTVDVLDRVVDLHVDGDLLSAASTERLLGTLSRTKSGPRRLKAGAPESWLVRHKTGTGQVLDIVPQGAPADQAGYNDVGILTAPDGTVYTGSFVDGLRDGTGKITMPDGFTYDGQWSGGEIEGTGTATYPNGDIYEGAFEGGKRQGQGTMRYKSGEEVSGQWVNGALQEAGTAPAEDAGAVPTPDATDEAPTEAETPSETPADSTDAAESNDG